MSERERPQKMPEKHQGSQNPGRTRFVGIALLAVAVLMWAATPAVLLVPLSAAQKAWTTSALLVVGEVAFWLAAAVLGREVVRRYRRFLDPRGWFGKKRR